MSRPRPLGVVVTLRTPGGEVLDLTDRLDLRTLGSLQEETEEQLLEFVHSGLKLRFVDPEGDLARRFLEAAPEDRFELVVERETGRRRPRYERIFGGLVDVSGGVEIEGRDRTVTLDAYGYSKLLEMASAENVRRTVEGVTGTVSSGSDTVTVSDVSDLEIDDEITLKKNGVDETHTIVSIDTAASTVTTDATWDNAFTDAELILETPYYRGKTVPELAALVLEEAGIEDLTVDLDQELSETPFPDSLNDSGLSRQDVQGITTIGGKIVVWEGGQAYEATDPESGFSAASGHGDVKADWWPYKASEPASLVEIAVSDDGTRVPDHDGGHYYYLVVDVDQPSPPNGPWVHKLYLYRDDGSNVLVDSYNTNATLGPEPYTHTALEFNETTGEILVSYRQGTYGGTATTKRYTTALALAGTFPEGAAWLRHVQAESAVACLSDDSASTPFLRLRDATTGNLGLTMEYRSGLKLWTLRKLGDHLAAIRQDGTGWYVVLWDRETGVIVAEHKVAEAGAGRAFLTVWTDPATSEEIGVGFAGPVSSAGGGQYFVLSREASGIVPYADFDGMSCSEALQQLALVSAAYLVVDAYGQAWLVGRSAALSRATRGLRELSGSTFSRRRRPVWDWYRTSVLVKATSQTGEEIEMLVGDTGDTRHRLELELQLRVTYGLAGALAAAYLRFHGRQLEQQEVTVDEPDDGPVSLLEQVALDGSSWLVLEAETDLVERVQSLTLVSLEEVA